MTKLYQKPIKYYVDKARQSRKETMMGYGIVKRGDVLEYNPDLDDPSYDGLAFDERPGSKAKYAVALQDEDPISRTLLVNDGDQDFTIPSRWISCYNWFGWIPEHLETLYLDLNRRYKPEDEDLDGGFY